MTEPTELTEQEYRTGCERWMAGDLEAAALHLDRALAASPGPEVDPRWSACSRARAQVAMAAGDLETAAARLARLPDDLVGAAQTLVLRGRLAHLRGDVDLAGVEVSGAVVRLEHHHEHDLASLMNGAIALAGAAELLVDLGYGEEADRLVARASERVRQAGVDDPAVTATLTLARAGAARLVGDRPTAEALLGAVDTSLSTDLAARAALERARLAAAAGDEGAARDAYAHAAALAVTHGDRSLAQLAEIERRDGPAQALVAPAPVERWPELRMGGADLPSREQLGHAVVVTLVVDRDPEAFLELDDAVCALLDARPELGLVDGNGSDGEVFELFLDGDDPSTLWDAVRPLVEGFGPGAGSRVVLTPVDGEPTDVRLA